MRGNMQPTGSEETVLSGPPENQDSEEVEWFGVGEKPLKDHVRNEDTVDWDEDQRPGIRLAAPTQDWVGDYPPRSDLEAASDRATPPYNPADPISRAAYLANGPQYEEDFDVHDYEEAEVIPQNADLSGYIVPQYD